MTNRGDGLLGQLVRWVEVEGDRPRLRRVAARWGMRRPALAAFGSVGALVRAAWADPQLAATVIKDLAGLAAGDEVAAQAAVAVVAPRLLQVVGRWARAGVPPLELEDMAAELVAEVLAQLQGDPSPGSPARVVDVAWGRVRGRRRRDRRAADRQVTLDPAAATPVPAASVPSATDDGAWATAAGVVVEGFRSGRLSLPAAQALWATGVAGWPSAEAAARLGCRPEALRARRSRAIRALAA
ncbi:MAG: hypothetical protein ACRDZ8_06285 [Acidimicrobiales bacterium]